jgi:poly(3-hydroxybutyrate) depolymerase
MMAKALVAARSLALWMALAVSGHGLSAEPSIRPLGLTIDSDTSGLWFNPEQSGHGLVMEVVETAGGQKLLLYWFVYLDGRQVWLSGLGDINNDQASMSLDIVSAGRFPPRFDPAETRVESWGELTVILQGRDQLVITWSSDFPGFNDGILEMTRLTRVGSNTEHASCLSGAYFNAAQSGHGILVDVSRAGDRDIVVATWFTFDGQGDQLWLQGQGELIGTLVILDTLLPLGGGFPPLFESEAVDFLPWGSLTLAFGVAPDGLQVAWQSDREGFANGSMSMQRLTMLSDHSCDAFLAPRYAAVDPSAGVEGEYPGFVDAQVEVAGLGLQDYFLFIPSDYQPEQSLPMLLAWHGAAGPGNARTAAQQLRNLWSEVAESENFIVVAQVATGSQGGWIPERATAILDSILLAVESRYNVDRARLFGWGFSAGGHVMHELVLERADQFAAYAVNAGVLDALAGSGAPVSASRRVPVSIQVGDRDSLQPFALSDRQRFENAGWVLGYDLFYQEFSGGHSVNVTQLNNHWQQLKGFFLP